MTSAAEERIKYYLVSAVNAILKDERYGIGLVRDEFQLTHKKIEGGYRNPRIYSPRSKIWLS